MLPGYDTIHLVWVGQDSNALIEYATFNEGEAHAIAAKHPSWWVGAARFARTAEKVHQPSHWYRCFVTLQRDPDGLVTPSHGWSLPDADGDPEADWTPPVASQGSNESEGRSLRFLTVEVCALTPQDGVRQAESYVRALNYQYAPRRWREAAADFNAEHAGDQRPSGSRGEG